MRVQQFYDRPGLVPLYDKFIDWPNRSRQELPFLLGVLKRGHAESALDCACGTGFHAIALAKVGIVTFASDADSRMIRLARKNGKLAGVHVQFRRAKWQQLGSSYQRQFDAVVCAGNSIPILSSMSDVRTSLVQMSRLVADAGVLVFDFRNFEKLLGRGVVIESGAYYSGHHGAESFLHVWDATRAGSARLYVVYQKTYAGHRSTRLFFCDYLSVRARDIARLLHRLGFARVRVYGDFRQEDFVSKQHDRVQVVAWK